MKRIALEDIDTHKPLAFDVCDADGRDLIAAGERVTPGQIAHLIERLEGQVFCDDDATDDSHVVISVDRLSPGTTLPADLFDVNHILLLRAGSKITPRFIQAIRDRHGRRGHPNQDTRVVVDDSMARYSPKCRGRGSVTRMMGPARQRHHQGVFDPVSALC